MAQVGPTVLGQDGSDWSRDLATLTFDLGGHGARCWYESSSSIRIPSLKFVGLAVQKIWRTMCVSVNGRGDLDLWPFYIETSMRVASKVGNLPSKFGYANPELFAMYATYGRTDGRTNATLIAPSLRAAHNKCMCVCTLCSEKPLLFSCITFRTRT